MQCANLDMGSRSLAARGAGAGEGEVGFDVGFDFGGLRAEEEEDTEQREGQGPRVQGVHDGRRDGGHDAQGREGLVGPGAVNEGQRRGDGDLVPHGWVDWLRVTRVEKSVESPAWKEGGLHDASWPVRYVCFEESCLPDWEGGAARMVVDVVCWSNRSRESKPRTIFGIAHGVSGRAVSVPSITSHGAEIA